MKIEFDIDEELKRELLDFIPTSYHKDIVGLSAKELLLAYCNYINRLIEPKPRKVFIAQNFCKNKYYSKYKHVIHHIKNKFVKGKDLNDRISRSIVTKNKAFVGK